MRVIPPPLQAELSAGAATLCTCWRLTRTDGVRLGFTDHDASLTFDGTAFEAASGFTSSNMHTAAGLSVDNLELDGALQSEHLRAADLELGRYDDAHVEVWRVNWRDPSQRVLTRTGSLGEVTRGPHAFSAEVRGIAHYLQQERGRTYQYACDADLGDQRCGVTLNVPQYRGVGSVSTVINSTRMTVSGLGGFAGDWFTRGLLTWASGLNAGTRIMVKRHDVTAGAVTLDLWQRTARAVAPGDGFTLTAGCDKRFGTCAAKFGNGVNFRGFPHMPGNDFVTAYPNSDDANLDGQSQRG
jgi:uncharacterized phage protein (TIGR02218 family)